MSLLGFSSTLRERAVEVEYAAQVSVNSEYRASEYSALIHNT